MTSSPYMPTTIPVNNEKKLSLVPLERDIQLSYLTKQIPIDIEFQDVVYSVPHGRKGNKIIIRNISGSFRSGELIAIVGPSGAGKSTLLNLLAGYKCRDMSGSVLINGAPRNWRHFRKLSRYIMQEDLLQQYLSVYENMKLAADLKLGSSVTNDHKTNMINEILQMLRMSHTKDTLTNRLSGGEKKRMSIALELLNNPPVLFLDEPTTGLDDVSSLQCVQLLKTLAEGGRTVICSIHTPSAKIFDLFDNVYVLAAGQCVYQGLGRDIVPFLNTVGIDCPKHYNPADFIIDCALGDYGDLSDKMIATVDNGRLRWRPEKDNYKVTNSTTIEKFKINEIIPTNDIVNCELLSSDDDANNSVSFQSSSWEQFKILSKRMLMQQWRNSNYLCLKIGMFAFIAFIISSLYWKMGNDGSKTLFNFGFCFTCMIVFLYIPLLPVLLYFPTEIQILKREHFNKWYGLNAYFCALTVTQLLSQIILGSIYVFIVYWATDQPAELKRLMMFYVICLLTGFISESFGLVISSQLSLINGMFLGPCLAVPLILLSVQNIGSGQIEEPPILIRVAMYFSFLRHGLEGVLDSVYGNDRPDLICPPDEDFCPFLNNKLFLQIMGVEGVVFWFNVVILFSFFIVFRFVSLYLLRQRLTPNKTFIMLHYVGKLVKSHFGLSYKY